MDAAGYPHMQGSGSAAASSSSCRAADYSAAWDAAQQQKRQRCQFLQLDLYMFALLELHYVDCSRKVLIFLQLGSSSNDEVGSSTENNFLEASGPELKFEYEKNEEEDYYFEEDDDDGCYDDDDDEGSDYVLDTSDYNQLLADKFDHLDLPPGVEATVPWLQKVEKRDMPEKFKSMSEIEEEIAKKYNFFKQFDTVEDFSDHKYTKNSVGKARKEWAKRIQHEWSLLEKDLPALIYVRVSENRMDLLRAVMIGPQGTPYHDGLFFFDAQFPASYPATPPVVHYHAGGLRLNPNLYDCGKVCLSLLGTWQGYERYANSPEGLRYALDYNDTAFEYSCRTMLYSLRRPPQHFEDLVAGHFRERGRAILAACKYYMEGYEVGSKVPEEDEGKDQNQNGEGSSTSSVAKPQQNKPPLRTNRNASFKTNLEILFEELLMEFNVKGANTAKFRAEKLKNQQAPA
ncbi:hypothetical protein U9M48_042684 [Paspalum notatum var. saurae]|uniref:UBC core domain-containing protein n=1 Tax=Paspalum notatum var. saurae TaxID=547442 RepID=A0AAQ3UR28_PASNO